MKESRVKMILAFRIFAFFTGTFGIVLHFLVNSILDQGFMVKHNWAYFTLQTNVFSTLIFLILIVKTYICFYKQKEWKVAQISSSLHLACTFFITLTMLGFWLLLAPMTGVSKNIFLFLDTNFLHTFMPLLSIADYVFFASHETVCWKDIFKWLLYPLGYLISVACISKVIIEPYYTFKMGEEIIELMYPYPFLDANVMSDKGVFFVLLLLFTVFLLLGSIYIWINNRILHKKIKAE